MSHDTVLFPRCGITYGDVLSVTEKPISLSAAARRLGVSATNLERVATAHGFRDRFINRLSPPEEIAFPNHGITVDEVKAAAKGCPNLRAAARSLNVSERQLHIVAKKHGIVFQKRKPRPRCVSAEDVRQLAKEGYIKKDAAFLAGVEYSYFKELVNLYGLRPLFPSTGQAAAISRRGYTDPVFSK